MRVARLHLAQQFVANDHRVAEQVDAVTGTCQRTFVFVSFSGGDIQHGLRGRIVNRIAHLGGNVGGRIGRPERHEYVAWIDSDGGVSARQILILELECHFVDTIADGQRLAIGNQIAFGDDQRCLLSQPVVGVESAGQSERWWRGNIRNAKLFRPADFQLVITLQRQCAGREGCEGRIHIRVGHHFAAFAETNDDVVQIDTFMAIVDTAIWTAGRSAVAAKAAKLVAIQGGDRSQCLTNERTGGLGTHIVIDQPHNIGIRFDDVRGRIHRRIVDAFHFVGDFLSHVGRRSVADTPTHAAVNEQSFIHSGHAGSTFHKDGGPSALHDQSRRAN